MESIHELVVPNDDLSFKMFLFEGKDGNYTREKHWHTSIEIFAVFDGSLEFYINEEETHLKAGEFIIVNSNEVHSILSPEPNHTIVLQIPLQTFKAYYTEEHFICFTHHKRGQDEELMELIAQMYETYCGHSLGYELQVQSKFFKLIFLLVTQYRKLNVSDEIVRKSRNLNKLSAITGYIKENYAKDLSLESLGELFGYSPTYLSRMFKKYAQTSYRAYLQSIRLEYAYKELINTETPIGEIAFASGFADGRAFAKAFKKKYGILPSEYKRTRKCS